MSGWLNNHIADVGKMITIFVTTRKRSELKVFEIIKIISRILCGMLPILWIYGCFWVLPRKGEFDKLTEVITAVFMFIGIISCILSALGWLRIV